jgi:hypothetical protein
LAISVDGAIGIAGHRSEAIEANQCRGPIVASGAGGNEAAAECDKPANYNLSLSYVGRSRFSAADLQQIPV